MEQEEFNYKDRKVLIQLVQPQTGKWLYRISIDNCWRPTAKRSPMSYKEDALRFGIEAAKKWIDKMPAEAE
ncbi:MULTISPECIES: hypothetical protein [unclassified Herbaspirillum]|uniref:hypothetical protein n=1 Tax=unclassified Herbaspirillum TaxID=2624150 RepID=UPI00383A99C2